jgi:hypothetical protein
MTDRSAPSPTKWKQFWERGGWWKALILAAVYYGVYQLIGVGVLAIFPKSSDVRGPDGSATEIFFDTALPILLTSIVLLAFAASLGWLRELFAAQTIRGRRWMWIGVALVLALNISSLLGIDYDRAGLPLVMSWLFTGLCVGLAEELDSRGFVVALMRKAGHPESPSASYRPGSSPHCTSGTPSAVRASASP